MTDLTPRVVKPQIGVLPIGHFHYWDQFAGLKKLGLSMFSKLRNHLEKIGDVVAPELVDTMEKAERVAEFFRHRDIDILLIFPFGYAPSMCVVPAVQKLDAPIRILNAHEDSSYDYRAADTTIYLHHEGVCCVPEISGALVNLGKKFRVLSGHFRQAELWKRLRADCLGAAAARAFRSLNIGLIGEIYTNMSDMPIDEHRLLRATGKLLVRPEVEEIEEACQRVTPEQLQEMYREFREMYDVDETVTDEHMRTSAQVAVAYDEIIRKKYGIDAFGYYWWGEKELITQLRSQSALAVSRLSALGRPGVTEGDVKAAMAMKLLDLLGAGGMFLEFFSMDFDQEFLLMGHDGPSNINIAAKRPRLQHLEVHHGKSGRGLGIDFEMQQGPMTLLNLTQFGSGDTFKLIYTVAEVVAGEVLGIGNPNCRVRVSRPIPEFMDAWCQEGPEHHIALGLGDRSAEIETFAEAMGFGCIRV
jgi:L-arabinose isomerase